MNKVNTQESFAESNTESNTDTSSSNTEVVQVVEKIFKNANLYILAIFLLVYLVIFIGFGMYIGQNQEKTIRNTFDFVMFGLLFIYIVYLYYQEKRSGNDIVNSGLSNFVELYDDDLALFSTMLFVVCFYLLLFLLRVPGNENKPVSVFLIEGVTWLILATLAIHNLLKYFFNIDLLKNLRENDYQQYLDNVMNGDEEKIEEEPEETPEVFNISNNLYNYEDAQAVCKTFDSRLATYDEIESAYNNGAEWCTYGWSADQLALFPTQKESWKKRQGNCKTKNSCGRPGINGGYFRNPNIKFGVNCYGVKPVAKKSDLQWMETKKMQPFPRTRDQRRMDDKVEYWKNNLDKIIVNSFNKDKWSRF
uniref:Link domain-containing protein n=1 Tax=viral metagenome TaxID=1070528 RepID=A0A6C0CMD9_9ZZZZ